MARDESENFRVRPGRSRNGGARINPRTQPFLKQVQIAVRKAGGDPRRIGSGALLGGRAKLDEANADLKRYSALTPGLVISDQRPRQGLPEQNAP